MCSARLRMALSEVLQTPACGGLWGTAAHKALHVSRRRTTAVIFVCQVNSLVVGFAAPSFPPPAVRYFTALKASILSSTMANSGVGFDVQVEVEECGG